MNRSKLRLEISRIFIKWGLSTRQVAIIEIVNLIEKEVEDNMAKGRNAKKEKKKPKKPMKPKY